MLHFFYQSAWLLLGEKVYELQKRRNGGRSEDKVAPECLGQFSSLFLMRLTEFWEQRKLYSNGVDFSTLVFSPGEKINIAPG